MKTLNPNAKPFVFEVTDNPTLDELEEYGKILEKKLKKFN